MFNPFNSGTKVVRSGGNDYEVPADSYPPDDVPHPVRPLVEHAPNNFAGRGTETHGVTPQHYSEPQLEIFDQGEVKPDHQREPERHEVPVPVRIVNTDDVHEIKSFGTTQTSAGQAPVQLVGRDTTRTNLVIRNLSASTGVSVFIGTQRSANTMNGFPIDPGGSESLTTTEPIWGVSADGSTVVPIAIMWEAMVQA